MSTTIDVPQHDADALTYLPTEEALNLLTEASLKLLPAFQLPKYGPTSLEEATTKLYPNISEKLYFSAADMEVSRNDLFEPMELDLEVKETTEEQDRVAKIMEKSKLKDLAIEKEPEVPKPKSKSQMKKEKRAIVRTPSFNCSLSLAAQSAGPEWYNLKPPPMTAELEQDLKIIKLRGFINPKKFFKRQEGETPTHFEVGTLQANPLDFYTDGRNKAKMSKRHFVDDLIEDQEYKKYAKRRYREIQNARSGLKRKFTKQKGGIRKKRKL